MTDDAVAMGARATLVVGGGGLLGQAVVAALRSLSVGPVAVARVRWSEGPTAAADLTAALAALRSTATPGTGWRLVWCAGAGVTGTSAETLAEEVSVFESLLHQLAAEPPEGPGQLFLASSAGGVFAGSLAPPFTEDHAPRPLAPYGHAKLAMEATAGRFADTTGYDVIIGRIANLYGPGQNLAKSQGLISHLCRTHLTGQPLSIYVSLDTIRDYLYVDDCARMIRDLLAGRRTAIANPVVKILASHQAVTVGALIGECRRLFKRTPRVVLGSSPQARFQVKDLRLRSVVQPDVDRRGLTPLPVGIATTAASMLRSVQRART